MRFQAILVVLALTAACRAPSSPPSDVHIGGEIYTSQSVRFALVEADPEKFLDQPLVVEGTVQAVCQKRGCWMQIADGESTAMARWEKGCGGAFAFPKDCVGKRVRVQGSVYRRQFTDDQIEHMQGEAGRDVAIARDSYEISTTAVVVLDD